MCYQKKEIKNKVLPHHKRGFDPLFVKVPCCHCPSCRKVRANDWFVRAYYEFSDNHRQAFFVTLDFDNEHLPTYKGMPCFDSEIIKSFFKRLRYYIGKFRYLYTCEYGGLLKRPHYHVVMLPEHLVTDSRFFSGVFKSWLCGRHTRVDTLQSVGNNKLAALQYITSYATKDITFTLDDSVSDMPLRYRPRTQASKGFGLQALADGRITPDMVLNGESISIPCGKNGKLVSFPIPRYYEMKLCFDYTWHPDEMKAELSKNDFGVQVAKARHNGRYVYQLRSFFASRLNDWKSPWENRKWYEVVTDCLSDVDAFATFLYLRPFVRHHGVRDLIEYELNGRITLGYFSNYDYYEKCFQWYENNKKLYDFAKCKIETERLIISAKYRARKRISENPQLRNYLVRKNFDFNKLNY